MTEQEKRRRRREMERRMRNQQQKRRERDERGGGFGFRLYVTAVLVGGCLLLSLFQTETSQQVCGEVKETIARQISKEEWQGWKERAVEVWKELPVIQEGKPKETPIYQPDTGASP